MKENRQVQFYKILGQELTKARERKNMSAYDLAKFVGEQWTTINKMENGGKFMAHHFVWLKEIGVNLNVLIGDVSVMLAELPEVEGEEIEQEEIKPKRKSNAKLNAAQAKIKKQSEATGYAAGMSDAWKEQVAEEDYDSTDLADLF